MTDNRVYCVVSEAGEVVGSSAFNYSRALMDARAKGENVNTLWTRHDNTLGMHLDGIDADGYHLQRGTVLLEGEHAEAVNVWAWMQANKIGFAQLKEAWKDVDMRKEK